MFAENKYLLLFLILAGELFAGVKVSGNAADALPAHSLFGWAVSVDGEFAAVSAPRESYQDLTSAGAVYIYKADKGNWVFFQKIIPSDPSMMKLFGTSVKLAGYTLLAGAPNDNEMSGSAYVYTYDGTEWKEKQKIIPQNPVTYSNFGTAVDIGQGIAIISSVGSADNDSASGSVYIYNTSDWTEDAVITSSEKNRNDIFGASIAIVSSTHILIGSPRAGGTVADCGAVYSVIKTDAGWNVNQKLFSPDMLREGLFGCSISCSQERFIVGAMQEKVGSVRSGAAYIYQSDSENNWTIEKKLEPQNKKEHDYFGMAVFIKNDMAFAGSPKWDKEKHNRNGDMGCIDVFSLSDSGWISAGKIAPEDGLDDDHFGLAVSSYENTIIIGARLNDNSAFNSGAVYFYNLTELFPALSEKFIPAVFQLYHNYPNPFNPITTIRYDLSVNTHVSITIYDILGRKVIELVNQNEEAGKKQVIWNGKNAMGSGVASGTYIYRITTQQYSDSKKMLFLK